MQTKSLLLLAVLSAACSGGGGDSNEMSVQSVQNKDGKEKEERVGNDRSDKNTEDNTSLPRLPQDPLFEHSWHLKNMGQGSFGVDNGGTVGADINVESVHASGISGIGIKIAVSDSGLERNHEDFVDRLLVGQHRDYSLTDTSSYIGDPDPDPLDTGGDHGTSVAGLIIATRNNNTGGRGVAYGAKVAGFNYIKYQDAANSVHQFGGDFDIFNYSYGFVPCVFHRVKPADLAKIKHGVNSLRGGKGAVYVKAAGNEFFSSWKDCGVKV